LLPCSSNPVISISIESKEEKVFEDICSNIMTIYRRVQPKKRLILCIDGCAPLSKQNQQRQRRFRASKEKNAFDSNCLTPGTLFMDRLTEYVKQFIIKQIQKEWKDLEIVFSNEKVPGEGEHKLINYLRDFGNPEETFCIFGMDADLIMLALGLTQFPNFWILRENPANDNFYYIDIGSIRMKLAELMRWQNTDENFDPQTAINDFVFMCFTVGNDFLPHVPSLEIIQGGVVFMFDVYKKNGQIHGHLTEKINNKTVLFRSRSVKHFFLMISEFDKSILEKKLLEKDKFFPDTLLEKHAKKCTNGKYSLDMKRYKTEYYSTKCQKRTNPEIKTFCHEYLEGMQWVLSYYTKGVPDWKWCFRHHYAPFAEEISNYIDDFVHVPIKKNSVPSTPFQQLLSVLPPSSFSLIPNPLGLLLTDSMSPLKSFCPETFDVDVSGKRQDWEGIVILPMVKFDIIEKSYNEYIDCVDESDRKRDVPDTSYIFSCKETRTIDI
jgi:5'-3' exoribonuclease 1